MVSKNASKKNIRNIGFIAHIDAGKTTVTERTLYYAGRIHKMGVVHDGTTTMDWMAQERERGITITSAATACEWNEFDVNIIDTPGHVDFTAEVERSLRVLDGGVVIFDAVAGVEPQSETVWRQADKYNVPRLCFVNKMDRTGADFYKTIDSISKRLQARPVAIQMPLGSEEQFSAGVDLIEEKAYLADPDDPKKIIEGPVPEQMLDKLGTHGNEMVERIAETDDDLITKYLEGQDISKDELKKALRDATIQYKLVPVLCGSALRNQGVPLLLDAITEYLPSPMDVKPAIGSDLETGEELIRIASEDEPFSALAFKAVADPFIGKLVYFRVYSGSLDTGDTVLNTRTGRRERLGRIVKMHAQRREDLESVSVGDIAAFVGGRNTTTGDTLCDQKDPVTLESITFPNPVMSVSVESKARADQDRLVDALDKLSDEDPTLHVSYDDEVGQTVMSGMGELHLDIIVDRIRREYKVEANIGKPRVAFREAIRRAGNGEGRLVRQTGGHGQFAHVILEIEPLERGAGFEFEDKIRGGAIPKNFMPAVQKGVRDALDVGPLSGYPVIDVRVSILDGNYHEVDSSEMAFRIAASMATKSAIGRARPTRLEPMMKLEVVSPGEFLGDVLGDLGRRRAAKRNIEGEGEIQVVKSAMPLAESFGYAGSIRSLSQGRASYSMEFENYEEVPEAEIAAMANGGQG